MKTKLQAGREEISPPQRNSERSRLRRSLVLAPALTGIFLLLAYAALHVLIRSGAVRERLEAELSRSSGHEVRILSLRLTPTLEIAASGVSAQREGKVRFQAESVVLRLLPWDLLSGTLTSVRLEKPLLRLALHELFGPSPATPPRLSLARLKIEEGEIVLENGGRSWAMRSVFVDASNVNVAGEAGLDLRARLPAVEADAALSFAGGPAERRARLLLFQRKPERPAFTAELALAPRDRGYRIRGTGKADAFRWAGESIDGSFDLAAELDEKGDSALLLNLKLAELPSRLLPFALPLRPRRIDARLEGSYSSAERSFRLAAFQMNSDSGSAAAEGSVAAAQGRWLIQATVRLREVPVSGLKALLPAPLRSASYSGSAAADLTISGPYGSPRLSGLAWSEGLEVAGEELRAAELAVRLPLELKGSSFDIRGGRIEGKNLSWGKRGQARVSLAAATTLLNLSARRGEPLTVHGDFRLRGGSFASADESRAGEGLEASGRFRSSLREGRGSFEGEARIDSLEVLWDKFFGDFQKQRPLVRLSGLYEAATEELRLEPLTVSLGSIGTMELRGVVRQIASRPEFRLGIESQELSLGPLYEFFIRDTFKAAHPIFNSLALSGKSRVALALRGDAEAFDLEGALRLEQSAIAARSGSWRVGPLELELPLSLRFPHARSEVPEAPRAGRLKVRELRFRTAESGGIETPVVLWNNALRFPEPVRIPLFGGTATLHSLSWRDLIGSPRDFSFSLSLSGLDLLELTEVLGWHRFGGTLSAAIPDLRWQGDALRSDGVITVDLFGGRATIRGLSIERPLSPLRSIETSVTLENVDLEQASRTFAFGRISGILRGTVADLAVTNGQPARFRAEVHTVPTRGVDQWISVEALNKITVLSSGNEAGALYGGLAGFFDFFRYSKLGFKAELRNDRLRLRGIESREGKEYLVVGTFLPPTVNVISHTQEIGFSELMRRLERVREPVSRSRRD